MKELEVLLNQRWVLKSENKELYYQLRDAIGDIRKYASDKLGCQVTENALMVKMEKMVSIMNPMLKLIHGGKLKVIKRLTQAFHTWQKVQLPLYMIK